MRQNIKFQFGRYIIAYTVALVLAIPTYGGSLVAVFLYTIFVTSHTKWKIEKAIVKQSDDDNSIGTYFDRIHYEEALAYAIEYGRISYRSGYFVRFNVGINGQQYFVTLNKTPGGNGTTFTSDKTESVFGD